MHNHSGDAITLIVTNPEQLDEAELLLRTAAKGDRNAGILVTRHGSDHYTLELSCSVPYGETREQRSE